MSPDWRGNQRILLYGGTVHSPVSPFATAMLVDGDEVAWLGEDSAAAAHGDSADLVLDLHGALVTPGFVDAHVHTTSTGLVLIGLDLTGAKSPTQMLDLVHDAAVRNPGMPILGHGWDETSWSEVRIPTIEEIDRATMGSVAYLSRIDVHSALVSSAVIDAIPGIADLDGFTPHGHLTRQAHHAVREWALADIGTTRREEAQRAMRQRAASLGIVAIHEMAGPVISSEDDLRGLQALTAHEAGPLLAAYWGELASRGGVDRALALGAVGAGGDLFIDGSIGSHTACLRDPYSDVHSSHGAQYLSNDDVASHIDACMTHGVQAGFHVIGDRATDIIIDAFEQVAIEHGTERMRAAQHRLEHAEMLDDRHLRVLNELGITASMQPMFDGLWGGDGGMYDRRLGSERAQHMNRFASAITTGVLVAFGSDAPVTDLGPWAAMRAAMFHHQSSERITGRAAFAAHTRAGWRSIGRPEVGVLAPGAPAHYAIWETADLVVQTPDERIAGWSTDPRSGTPGLPDLDPDLPLPRALRTVVAGRTIHDTGELS